MRLILIRVLQCIWFYIWIGESMVVSYFSCFPVYDLVGTCIEATELILADIFQQGDIFPANSCYFNRVGERCRTK
jgi:hypothetical protein